MWQMSSGFPERLMLMGNNKKSGTAFEKEFANWLHDNKGAWAHVLADKKNGQPFDIIAVRYGCAIAIDCKECESERFSFDRIEPNQRTSMWAWKRANGEPGYFAIKFPGERIRLISMDDIDHLEKNGIHSVNPKTILFHGYDAEEFNWWKFQ